jgi:hypothetical protein
MAMELTTHRVPEDPVSPAPRRDTWSPSWHSMSEDSVCHRTNSATHYCNTID